MPPADFAFLDRLADAADAVTLPLFRAGIAVEVKGESVGDFDPVTEADKGAELALRAVIRAAFPDHGIAGEEFEDHAPDAMQVAAAMRPYIAAHVAAGGRAHSVTRRATSDTAPT